MSTLRFLAWATSLSVAFSSVATAQVPFSNGISTRDLAAGLQGAGSLCVDSSGTIYAANLHDVQGPGLPTPVFRVLADGTVDSGWTAPLVDPDVGVLDPAGTTWLLGSYGGVLTAIDLATGAQSQWLKDSRLGNVDGLAFLPSGDLLVSAIDHSRIHQVNASSKTITVFADLSGLAMQGFGSLVVDPSSSEVFAATPLDGFLVALNADGSLADAAFAQGFLHMGQLALDSSRVLVSDNAAGILYAIDRSTRQSQVLVHRIDELAAGLVPVGNGAFVASRLSADSSQGTLYRIEPFTLGLSAPAHLGMPTSLDLTSPADAGNQGFLFLSDAPGPTQLADGRSVAIGFGNWMLQPFSFDSAGAWSLKITVPNDPALIGFTVSSAAVTMSPAHSGLHALSGSLSFTILP